jgi:16S rRNA (guanine527-N7)-methyltransferase
MSTGVMSRFESLLRGGLAELAVDPACLPQLLSYLAELEKWNAAYNLSGIRNAEEIVVRHLLDALAVLPAVSGRVIDIGSGAGIPGLILAIANPALQMTVLDSNGKKARFMRHVQRTLKLTNVEVIEDRAEAYMPAQLFDRIISRAFAALGDFLRVTGHLAAPGGKWLAMKGKLDADEQAGIPDGFVIVDVKSLVVPSLNEARHLIIAARS